ncbi:MAG: AMP-binding protein, partial [Anaerolineales bacterium]|nr:AMP-binding protein [Anaerolineales bacterium]
MMLTQTTRHQFKTLLETAVFHLADLDQDAIIFVATGQEPAHVTRGELQTAVSRTAAALHHLDIQPRDLVIIAHTDILQTIVAFWGAMRVGAIPSIFPTLTEKLDPAGYMTNMQKLIQLSQVRAVLTTNDFAPQLQPHISCPVYPTTQLEMTEYGLRNIETTTKPADIAFLQHSSGTTGLQKGVALSHRAVLNQLAAYADALQLTADDVVMSWLPLYHDMGLIAGFLLPLTQGIPLVLMSPFDWVQHPALLFRAIDRYRGTLCWLPNFAYNHCARRIRQRDT